MSLDFNVFVQESPEPGLTYLGLLGSGLLWTVSLALSAWIVALVVGTLIGVLRTMPYRWLQVLGNGYVELLRNIPLLVQLFLLYFVLPELLPQAVGDWIKSFEAPWGPFFTALVGLGLFTSARIAEQVRAGINSLAKGQRNAALAMGMTLAQTYRYVLLPMAARRIIPPLTSEFMTIFKNSSVALTIGVLELTAQAQQMNEFTFRTYEAFGAATVIYIAVALIVNRLMAYIERKSYIPGLMTQEC
ncbi:MAG: amino acid ABC transporter permease [Pseudomonas helleri]|uniref:ABC transporter permease subunit n=1 Tax=Pseudomonas helleri TaxID=1608996 RepID=A0A7X1WWI8_9PSED|nr:MULTISPECIES: amino acid ABC transporter permease [Pseudomonas]MQT76035.1 ABC transporter permease subunit [Pseudomonas helleri]MQT97947.1 ABC transporter permease subunit [Pseudomonas helleri]MQU33836.1 ABC transporter permease subunit [Pseudomonas helleri]